MTKLRAFSNQTITFDFPVTALIGPNGGGKTSVLSSCALLYKSMWPRSFFTKSPQFDKEMKHWSITYEVIDRKVSPNDTIRRTASFSNTKWHRDALDRKVLFFGVSRTLPAVERRDLSKFSNKNVVFPEKNILRLSTSAAEHISRILGKNVSKYAIVKHNANGGLTLFAGETQNGEAFSEFHFGAGESSIIKIVNSLEQIEKNSLVLIEEIENGLHPVAVQKLVEYLIDVAERKSAQIIFTTHSSQAISVLPADAVWAALDGHLQQGKLDIMSLRTIVGDIASQLTIFVEDEFAKNWVLTMLRSNGKIALDAIEIYSMGGDGTAVNIHKNKQKDPSSRCASICIIDGDSRQDDNPAEKIFRLPGQAPESYIYDSIIESIEAVSAKLSIRLAHPIEKQGLIRKTITDIRRSNIDCHLLYIQVGETLGYLSESTVQTAFLATWCECNSATVVEFLSSINEYLPKNQYDDK